MYPKDRVDWSESPLVESCGEVLGGSPVLRDTRMPADAIVDNFDYGVRAAEIADQFELSVHCVQAILAYAQSHRVAHPVR